MGDLFTIGIYLMGFVTLLDQGTKVWAMRLIHDAGGNVEVAPFFNIVLSMNKGVTFGLLHEQAAYMPYALIVVALAIIVVLMVWLARADALAEALGLGFVLGGAAGNVADRVFYGAVVDFLDFHYAGYHWYAFNAADAAIVAGVCLLLLDSFLRARKNV